MARSWRDRGEIVMAPARGGKAGRQGEVARRGKAEKGEARRGKAGTKIDGYVTWSIMGA